MDFDSISEGVGLLALLLSIGNIGWAWISQPARDVSKRIDEVEQDAERGQAASLASLKEHDRRIQRVEDDIRHLPIKDDLHALEKTLAQVEARLTAISNTVTRVDDFLRAKQ